MSLLLSVASLGAAQSLGEFARQQRLAKNLPTASHHVITNEDISAGNQAGSLPAALGTKKAAHENNNPVPAAPNASSSEQLREKIKAQKQKVLDLQAHIQEIQKKLDARHDIGNVTSNQSVYGADVSRFTSYCGLAVADSSRQEWCDEPAKWKADLEKTNEKLQTEQAKLEALQEQARQLGFGNSFYDPD